MTGPVDINSARQKRVGRTKPKPVEGWEATLHVDGYGNVKRSLANVLTILSSHPEWVGVLAYDAFADAVVTKLTPPVRIQDKPTNHGPGEWTEADSVRTAAWLAESYRIDVGVLTVEQAVPAIARKNIVHPVRDYLRSLRWDATQRLPSMLVTYLGAEKNAYTEAIGTKWMLSAVARVMNPGCKADHLLVLEGEQGTGKSTALKTLAGQWFTDTGVVLGDKDSYQNLRRVWIYEFGELSSIRSAKDVERVKGFISSASDRYRPSFGRRAIDFPRQCVFAGSTNEGTYLADRTGNRRFWPVKTGHIDLVGLERDRNQLWAEAVARYESRETWHVDSLELVAECRERQEEREQIDPWVQFAVEWLANPTIRDDEGLGRGLGYPVCIPLQTKDGITTTDLLVGAIGMKRDRIDRAAETRAGQVLKHLGWERRQVRNGSVRVWRYFDLSLPVTTSDLEGGDTQ